MLSTLLLASSSLALAQLTMPALTTSALKNNERPITATEAAFHVGLKEYALDAAVALRNPHYPVDSIRSVVSTTATQWLQQLAANPVRGIQLDPSAKVGVSAGRESYAKAQIEERLATRGLSFNDKAFAFLTAVRAFSSLHLAEQLPIAEQYLTRLDAMGDSAASWQFEARLALIQSYYLLGRSKDIARLGTRAVTLLTIMPYANRSLEFQPTDDIIYGATVEALAGEPDGAAKIARMSTEFLAAAVPSPAMIALDSAYDSWLGHWFQSKARRWVQGNARLGTQGAPVTSNYWVNRPTSDSATIPVNDGKIRVLEVATFGCVPCIAALQGIQRLQDRFPQIQTMMLTWTYGYWGNRLVETDTEAAKLTDFFLNDAKVRIPVAIWKGKKVMNIDGGMTPENYGPNVEHYPLFAKPMLWVLDGHGTIRRIITGYSRDIEVQLASTVQFLLREAELKTARVGAAP
jgi:hypothetical protein